MIGPETAVGDQVAHQDVVPPVLQDHLAQPGDEPPAAEQDERPVLGADIDARKPLGQVVRAAAVVQ